MGSSGSRRSQASLERESSFSRDWDEFHGDRFDRSLQSTLFSASRDGKWDELINLWPQLTYDDLNRDREPSGATALHAAFYNDHLFCAAVLLFWSCKDNIQDKYGRTAFEFIKENTFIFRD
jgi:hypothetical protein